MTNSLQTKPPQYFGFAVIITACIFCIYAVSIPVFSRPVFGKKHQTKEPEIPVHQNQTVLPGNISIWNEASSEKSQSVGVTLTPVFPDKQWWEQFNDPYLNQYIIEAFEHNRSLQQAVQRVEEARALARETLGKEFPAFTFAPAFNRQKNSKTLTTPNTSQFTGTGVRFFAPGQTVNIYNIPLNASYEADVFLRNRLRSKGDRLTADTSEWDKKGVMASLGADVATAYFNLIQADALIARSQEEVALLTLQKELLLSRYASGLSAYADILQKNQEIDTAVSGLTTYQKNQALSAHQLAYLLGRTQFDAPSFQRKSLEEVILPMTVQSGIPSELIAHRPDILATETRMKKMKLDVSIARRAFLPTFNITGQVGLASTRLSKFSNIDSLLASVGSSMSETIFNGGIRQAELKYRKALYKENLLAYHDVIVKGLKEVEDSLAVLEENRQSYQQTLSVERDTKEETALFESRYQTGLLSYPDYLQQKRQWLAAQKQSSLNKTACLIDMLSVFKALGGGW